MRIASFFPPLRPLRTPWLILPLAYGMAVTSLFDLLAWGCEGYQSRAKWDCVTLTMMSFGMPRAVA